MKITTQSTLCLVATLAAGCPTMSSMQSARTLDADQSRFIIAPEVSRYSLGTEPLDQPQIEMGYRYGITDSLEVGAKLWIPGLLADVKYALMRSDGETGWDLSIAPGISYIGGMSGTRTGSGSSMHVTTLYLPLLVGYNRGGGDQIVIGPQLANQTWVTTDDEGTTANILYAGTSIGYHWQFSKSVALMPEISFGAPIVQTLTGFGSDVGLGALLFQGGVAFIFGE